MVSFRVALLVGLDCDATRACIRRVAAVPAIEVTGIFLDTATDPFRRRVRNLRRNIRREGFGYAFHRGLDAAAEGLDRLAAGFIPSEEVDALLRRAFPHEALSLDELASRLRVPLVRAGNLNSPHAAALIAAASPDLGIVVGTRVLKRTTFGVPRLGCINLHKGRVPEYRGLPPGFWELYEGAASAGITVHFVDDGLDTGDIVSEESLPIRPGETLQSLTGRLDAAGAALLARSVARVAEGSAERRRQPAYGGRTNRAPTRRQRRELERRTAGTDRARPGAAYRILKTLGYLALFHSGALRCVRALRFRSRACVVLYHRVNDESADVLTTSRRRFAEHLVLMRRYYNVVSSEWIVDKVRSGGRIQPTSVAIHFDDCYEDVHRAAAPLIEAAGLRAAAFVSSGYVDTNLRFRHDGNGCPHEFANLTSAQLRTLPERGIDVGSHTVTHADMGRVSIAEARTELRESKAALEKILGRAVDWFSFPYGRPENFRPDVEQAAREAGYTAVFAASGGVVTRRSSPFNIPRIGGTQESRPLDLLFEIEGLSFACAVVGARRLMTFWSAAENAVRRRMLQDRQLSDPQS